MPVDRSRRFTLPGIQDLNKDQDAALALPLKGQHLIVGGPGTGKSVVALLRARRLAQDNKPYRVLVYNRLLDQSNQHLSGSEIVLTASTWEKWFRGLWREQFSVPVPALDPKENSSYREIDWPSVERKIQEQPHDAPLVNNPPLLIIDEGQDMPPAFYLALANLGFEDFYVVADQNQQIHPDKCSSRQDIENALTIDTMDTLELKTNYRNTRPVAMLAQHFYPADPASPRPDLPNATPAARTPELLSYGLANTPSLADIAVRILQLSDRNPKKLIGIIAPDNQIREKFRCALDDANPRLDNGKPPIQTYKSGQQDTLNFGVGGIMVINAQSCKGLEFDTVILADIDRHNPKSDAHILKARFYVMVARAREHIILLRTGNVCSVVESLLPANSAILVTGFGKGALADSLNNRETLADIGVSEMRNMNKGNAPVEWYGACTDLKGNRTLSVGGSIHEVEPLDKENPADRIIIANIESLAANGNNQRTGYRGLVGRLVENFFIRNNIPRKTEAVVRRLEIPYINDKGKEGTLTVKAVVTDEKGNPVERGEPGISPDVIIAQKLADLRKSFENSVTPEAAKILTTAVTALETARKKDASVHVEEVPTVQMWEVGAISPKRWPLLIREQANALGKEISELFSRYGIDTTGMGLKERNAALMTLNKRLVVMYIGDKAAVKRK